MKFENRFLGKPTTFMFEITEIEFNLRQQLENCESLLRQVSFAQQTQESEPGIETPINLRLSKAQSETIIKKVNHQLNNSKKMLNRLRELRHLRNSYLKELYLETDQNDSKLFDTHEKKIHTLTDQMLNICLTKDIHLDDNTQQPILTSKL